MNPGPGFTPTPNQCPRTQAQPESGTRNRTGAPNGRYMPEQQHIHVPNLVIGVGLVGSITAYVLAQHGERGLLLERNQDPGGVNGSFADPEGHWFDHGRHVINADRSDFTSRFFREVLGDDGVREFDLHRGIVVRGHLLPYAAPPVQWPEELRENLRIDPEAPGVHLGAPREAFARAYGQWFADLVFDEMMSAYPTLMWKREHGIPEEQLLDWLFPWFFPRTDLELPPQQANEQGVYSAESRNYHHDSRHADPPREPVLYPASGGYARWIHAMLEQAAETMEIRTGLADTTADIDPETLEVRSVAAGGVRYTADRVFWCAPLPVLCKAVGWELPGGEPQWELLGSFTFDRPVNTDCHEILCADPRHQIRRINFPGRIAGDAPGRTVQVEYTTLGEEARQPGDEWRAEWLRSLHDLGVIDPGTEPTWFDYRPVPRGVVSTADLQGFLASCGERLYGANGNLFTPHLAVASDNNARLVPRVHECIAAQANRPMLVSK